MVLEARRIVDQDMIVTTTTTNTVTRDIENDINTDSMKELYNRFSYDDAAQYVYGMEYNAWKQLHMKPTTAEQLQKYQASMPLHAKHDTELLQPRISTNTNQTTATNASHATTGTGTRTVVSSTEEKETEDTKDVAVVENVTPTTATTTTSAVIDDPIHTDSSFATVVTTTDGVVVTAKTVPSSSASNVVVTTTIPTTTSSTLSSSLVDNAAIAETKQNDPTPTRNTFHSNVCCVDMDDDDDDIPDRMMGANDTTTCTETANATTATTRSNRNDATIETTTTVMEKTIPLTASSATENQCPNMKPMIDIPDMMSYRNGQFPVIAIVTISDRAYAGIYPDQSGPMIADTIRSVPGIPSDLQFIMNMIVPDDMAAIQAKIRTICDNGSQISVDCIITTGGTGFGIRDVTPEATREIVTYELMNFISFILSTTVYTTNTTTHIPVTKSSSPFASPNHKKKNNSILNPIYTASLLSRGVVGVISSSSSPTSSSILETICDHHTLIVNLPGSPTAIQEMLPIILPYILHIIVELQHVTPDILHIG